MLMAALKLFPVLAVFFTVKFGIVLSLALNIAPKTILSVPNYGRSLYCIYKILLSSRRFPQILVLKNAFPGIDMEPFYGMACKVINAPLLDDIMGKYRNTVHLKQLLTPACLSHIPQALWDSHDMLNNIGNYEMDQCIVPSVLSSSRFDMAAFKFDKLESFFFHALKSLRVDVDYVKLLSDRTVNIADIVAVFDKHVARKLSWRLSPRFFSSSAPPYLMRLLTDRLPRVYNDSFTENIDNWDRLLFRSIAILAISNYSIAPHKNWTPKKEFVDTTVLALKQVKNFVMPQYKSSLAKIAKTERSFEAIMSKESVSKDQHLTILRNMKEIFKTQNCDPVLDSTRNAKDGLSPVAKLDIAVNFIIGRVKAYSNSLPGDWMLNLEYLWSNTLLSLPGRTICRFWQVFMEKTPSNHALLDMLAKHMNIYFGILQPLLPVERVIAAYQLDPSVFSAYLNWIPYEVRKLAFFKHLRNQRLDPYSRLILNPSAKLVFNTTQDAQVQMESTGAHQGHLPLSSSFFLLENVLSSLWERCFKYHFRHIYYEPISFNERIISFSQFMPIFWDLFFNVGLRHGFFFRFDHNAIALSPILPSDLVQVLGFMIMAAVKLELNLPYFIHDPCQFPIPRLIMGHCTAEGQVVGDENPKDCMAHFFAHFKAGGRPVIAPSESLTGQPSACSRIQSSLRLGMNRIAGRCESYFSREELHNLLFNQRHLP